MKLEKVKKIQWDRFAKNKLTVEQYMANIKFIYNQRRKNED